MAFVVERYLPGLLRSDLLPRRLSKPRAAGGHQTDPEPMVRYLGSTIVLGDEVLLLSSSKGPQRRP